MHLHTLIHHKHNRFTWPFAAASIGLILLGIMLTSCASREIEPGTVYKEWSQTFAQLAIFPIFPPREDVQVGDTWVLPLHPYDKEAVEGIGGLGRISIWLDSHDITYVTGTENVRSLTNQFYKKRPSFPETDEGAEAIFGATDSQKIWRVESATQNIFKSGDVCRLRQVAFPEFSSTRITGTAASTLIPAEALNVALGLSYSQVNEAIVKIPMAESYGLPAVDYLRIFDNEKTFKPNLHHGCIKIKTFDPQFPNEGGIPGLTEITLPLAHAMFQDALSLSTSSRHRRKLEHVYLTLVTEVFYARAIDVTLISNKAFGASANVQPIAAETLEALERMSNIETSGTEITSATTQESSEGETQNTDDGVQSATRSVFSVQEVKKSENPYETFNKMQQAMAEVGNQTIPGGSLQLVSVSNTSVSMRRIFDRPIAVGVRGILLKLKPYPEEGYFIAELD